MHKNPIEIDNDFLDDFCNAHSTNDCTGLIPSGAATDEEIESYNEVYHFLPEE